jgi:hypothetical protein
MPIIARAKSHCPRTPGYGAYMARRLPLDFWSNLAWRLARRTVGPSGTIPPAPVAVVVHAPPLRVHCWRGSGSPATTDRRPNGQKRSQHNDEDCVGVTGCEQAHNYDNHHQERKDQSRHTRLASRRGRLEPEVDLCPLGETPPVHGPIHARFQAPTIHATELDESDRMGIWTSSCPRCRDWVGGFTRGRCADALTP